MKSSKYAVNLKAGGNNEFTLKTQSQHRDEIHYIGVSAFTVGNIFILKINPPM